MNDLMEVDCPACSKALRFKPPAGRPMVALSCPACAHFFQVPLNSAPKVAQPVVATPIQAPLAPIDEFLASPEYSRPIITSRAPVTTDPVISPWALMITALVTAGILGLGVVGYLSYRALSSVDVAGVVSPSIDSPSLLSDAGSASNGAKVGDVHPAAPLAATTSATETSADPAVSSARASSVLNALARGDKNPATHQPPVTTVAVSPGATAASSNSPSSPSGDRSAANSSSIAPPANSGHGSEELADVIERAEQSVVRIEVTSADGESLGSGFVVDNEGTLVTNCHVLAGALSAVAHFPNGRRCVITGTKHIDQSRDIVIAKLADESAPSIGIAANLPRKGEQVTALGAPHGLAFTATRGIISAIRAGAEIGSEQQGTWIQVDAALSPGNSGGPLINSVGDVVGMSTLASQGSAQNLNFGISGQDIREALAKARSATTLTLAAGIGHVDMAEQGQSRGSDDQIIVQETTITQDVLAEYVSQGVEDFSDLQKSLRNESTRLSLELKEMKRGETFMPPALRNQDAAVARVLPPGQRTPKWYFLNESTKQEVIKRQLEKIKTFTKLKTEISDPRDADSLFELLWNHGPRLDVRRNNSIGYVTDLLVLHAFNDHDVLVLLDDTPYMLWAPSTAGMSAGELWEGPVFVAGTTTAQLRDGLTTSVTVLQLVSEKQLREAVLKVTQPSHGFRTWSDRSGSFSIEAKLLGQDATQVALQKRDGTIISVPRDKLSQTDIEFLSQ